MIGDNTQNGYIAGGTRLKTTLNCRGYSIPLTLYAWLLKIRVIQLGLFYLSFTILTYFTKPGHHNCCHALLTQSCILVI